MVVFLPFGLPGVATSRTAPDAGRCTGGQPRFRRSPPSWKPCWWERCRHLEATRSASKPTPTSIGGQTEPLPGFPSVITRIPYQSVAGA